VRRGAKAVRQGQSVKISDELPTIIGVMPASFHFPVADPSHFWTTFAADAEGTFPRISRRDDDRLYVVGRLKSGITIQQSVADLTALRRRMAEQFPGMVAAQRAPYQTRQAFRGIIGWPTLHPKAWPNSGMFLTTPFTRNSRGECGSVCTCSLICSGRTLPHQFWP
jgi:hypothetical protein